MDWPNLKRTMEEYAAYFEVGVKNKMPNTYRIAEKIHCEFKIEDNLYTVIFNAPGYFPFLEYGRGPGKQPPVKAIKEWIEVKKIKILPDKNGKTPSVNSVAFLIARSIGLKGTSIWRAGGLKFFQRTYEEQEQYWDERIATAIGEDIRADIKIWFEPLLGDKIITIK